MPAWGTEKCFLSAVDYRFPSSSHPKSVHFINCPRFIQLRVLPKTTETVRIIFTLVMQYHCYNSVLFVISDPMCLHSYTDIQFFVRVLDHRWSRTAVFSSPIRFAPGRGLIWNSVRVPRFRCVFCNVWPAAECWWTGNSNRTGCTCSYHTRHGSHGLETIASANPVKWSTTFDYTKPERLNCSHPFW